MKHIHRIPFIYTKGCPPCKVRQLRYGFRLDPLGYQHSVNFVRIARIYTPAQRRWILAQVGEL